jgi:hypothetical protein
MLNTSLGVVFVCTGLALSFHTLLQLWRAHRSLAWPPVEADVVEKRVDVTRSPFGSHYTPVVKYRYEAEGIHHEGSRLIFAGQSISAGSREEAESFLGPVHVGTRLTIRVCPSKPRLSVIVPGHDARWWIPLAFALAAILVGMSAAVPHLFP